MKIKYKTIDDAIKKTLKRNNTSYEPYHFSLNDKLKIGSQIKKNVNKNIEFVPTSIIPNNIDNLDKLRDTGIIQFSKPFLNHSQLHDIHNFLKSKKAYPSHIPYYDKFHEIKNPYNFKGKILSFNAKTIIETPHLIELLSSSQILELVSNYLGTTPTLFDLNVIFNFGDVDIYHETQHFHRDHDDFHHCLLMVYLNDVDINSGGHIYAQNSHKADYLSSSIKPLLKANNSVTDIYDEKDNFIMETVIGKKGTGFISDANGLHSGSVPKIGRRRMIFWARFGLAPNYMWEHHNHQYWGYNPNIFSDKVKNKYFDTNYIFRLFTEEYNHEKAMNYKTRGDGCMKKTVKYGWNIGVYGSNYFAMKQKDGDVKIEKFVNPHDKVDVAQKKVSHLNVLVNNNEDKLIKLIQKFYAFPQPELVIQNYLYHNIIGFKCKYFAVLETDESIDIQNLQNKNILKSRNLILLKIMIKIKIFLYSLISKNIFFKPKLIEDHNEYFNIIGYQSYFFAVRKSAGPIDVTNFLSNPEDYSGIFIKSKFLKYLKYKISKAI